MRLTLAFLLGVSCLLAQPNTLSPAEKQEGWILLFDGKTLAGWDQGTAATWRAEDGVLVADAGAPVNLRSTAAYSDFILRIDFRNSKEGNSGIFLRSALEGRPEVTGYELQVWNESPAFPTGSLVNHFKAKPASPAPDVWHTYEITAQGDHFVIVLDGETLLDARDSKSAAGYFLLQFNKGRKIEFRNIKLKKL
ncbi:MAG: DUF1080 domain-containing protein [Bryobacterales bacterium]|nr:DUF1080 domain-containing protein [Bryobacterales bacterium]